MKEGRRDMQMMRWGYHGEKEKESDDDDIRKRRRS